MNELQNGSDQIYWNHLMKLERCDEYNSDENISIILHKSAYLSGFSFNFITNFY